MEVLHSKILGHGRPLLILHGFLGMSDNWKTLGNQYTEKGYQVHLIDQRNHGKSFHSPDFDYQFLAGDVNTYMTFHQIPEAAILGHSMGGKTAMQFACSYPDKVSKLIIADIAPKFYPPHHQGIINALLNLDFGTLSSRKETDEQLSKYLTDFGIRQFLLKNLYWKEKNKLALRFNLAVLKDKMEEIGATIDAMDSYEGDTLFLRGSRSEYILLNDFGHIKRHFPKASLETIANAGHWLHAENPKAFFSKTMEFLNS